MPVRNSRFWIALGVVVLLGVLVKELVLLEPHIVFCDVGQGDAVLIIDSTWQVLIDGGPDSLVLECLARHMPIWDRKIEVVIATHSDSDHIAGLVTVLERYQVDLLLSEFSEKKTAEFDAFKKIVSRKVREEELQVLQPHQGAQLTLQDDFKLDILWPPGEKGCLFQCGSEAFLSATEAPLWDEMLEKDEKTVKKINYNTRSIAILLHFYGSSILLMGDLESAQEQALLTQSLIHPVNILKAGHHGSNSSSSQQFIDAAQPETVIISVGKKNAYGHPAPEVIERFEASGTSIFSTAERGDIVFRILQEKSMPVGE